MLSILSTVSILMVLHLIELLLSPKTSSSLDLRLFVMLRYFSLNYKYDNEVSLDNFNQSDGKCILIPYWPFLRRFIGLHCSQMNEFYISNLEFIKIRSSFHRCDTYLYVEGFNFQNHSSDLLAYSL
jgi:hypothetical protein